VRRGPITIARAPAANGATRLAFAIARRVGPAVTRNRLRRRLRAIFAELSPPPGSYLVSAGPSAGSRESAPTFEQLRDLVATAIRALDASEVSSPTAVG
jgi:RNase P protein component